ncbi:MAG: VCBS repeat-containing protein [Ginsengibacter sp.]
MNKLQKIATVLLMTLPLLYVDAQETLFSLVPSHKTGVNFTNTIPENNSLHIMNYEYLYNGHGIGVGDFNNDGFEDIFISGNAVPNKLFLNRGTRPGVKEGFSFDDVTKNAGVAGNGTWSTGVVVADINGDGLMDVYVCHSGKYADPKKLSNELYLNLGVKDGAPVFKESAEQCGLDAPGTQSTMAVFFDYDLDGDLDMFLVNHALHSYDPFENTSKMRGEASMQFGNRLFKNMLTETGKFTFTDVTATSGIINNALNYGLSVGISDLNMDGWPDIYTSSDYTEKDCFYTNNKNGTFTESLQKSFTQISKYSMGSDIADCNNDGIPDVVTLDMLPEDNHRQKLLKGPDEYDRYHLIADSGFYYQQMRNMLHLNEGVDEFGNARFSEVAQLAGISNTDWSWSALWADLDNDGWKDLFITNGYLRDFTNMDFLKYTVADYEMEKVSKGKLDFKTYDLVKKMPSNKLSNYAFQNLHDLKFRNVAKEWGLDAPSVSNAVAYADFDNDGDLDLIVGNNNEPVTLYNNNAQTLNHSFTIIALKGKDYNTQALGAKVYVFANGGKQFSENYTVRGYQSTVTNKLHFGLNTATFIDSLVIVWPRGTTTRRYHLPVNTLLQFNEHGDSQVQQITNEIPGARFRNITAKSGINFIHKENEFIDFKSEVLLPWQLSRYGPALAKADINGDGLDDFFVGGAIEQPGNIFLQQKNGKFSRAREVDIEKDSASEDVSAVFFDANGDGYADLYVVSGGDEYEDGAPEYQDRLYLNDGKGNFTRAGNALPSMLSSKLAIAVADYDGDGDMDIFIGGKAVPGSFPLPARSYLLRNDGNDGIVKFTDVTSKAAPGLLNPGMVTAAAWMKNKNESGAANPAGPSLIIAGDFMPIRYFRNSNGKFIEQTDNGFQNTDGFWSSLLLYDIDGDGNMDLIAGNCGDNLQYKATLKKPILLYYADFDGNGNIDPIMTYYNGDKSYPAASRDEIQDQMTGLKKLFVSYKDYADAGIKEIVTPAQLAKAKILKANTLQSVVFINDGNNHFTNKTLPVEAQFSRVSSVLRLDTNRLLLSGNFYPYRTQWGHCDASMGLIVSYDKDKFSAEAPYQSGLYLTGDVRNTVLLKGIDHKRFLLVAANNQPLQLYEIP